MEVESGKRDTVWWLIKKIEARGRAGNPSAAVSSSWFAGPNLVFLHRQAETRALHPSKARVSRRSISGATASEKRQATSSSRALKSRCLDAQPAELR
jgi:hypothetical protein